MPFNFYWSAQQSLEKILKATLLLNGEKTKSFSHGLKMPFERAQIICGDLLPSVLVPHRNFYSREILSNYAEPSIDFVERIETEGDPSNRYRHFGVHYRQADLHKLYNLYFSLRRTAFPLSMPEEIFGSYRVFLENTAPTNYTVSIVCLRHDEAKWAFPSEKPLSSGRTSLFARKKP